MVNKHTEPDVNSWKLQEDRRRRASRNQKLGALAFVALIGIVAVAIAIRAVDDGWSDPRALYHDRNGIGPGSFYGGVTWSPDGTQIAFVLNWEFFIMNADGSGLRTADFPKHAAFGYRPAWQPIDAKSEVGGG